MRVGPYRLAPDWGQIGFATAILAWIVWYYFDALRASANVQNMLLIRPATIAALILYAVVVYSSLNVVRGQVREAEEARTKAPFDLRAPMIATLLCLYVASLFVLGFDVSTFAFVTLAMWAAGERRIWFLLGFSAVFAAILALGFRFALSVPVPTLLF